MAKMNQTEYGRMHPDLAKDVIMSSKMPTTNDVSKLNKLKQIVPDQTSSKQISLPN